MVSLAAALGGYGFNVLSLSGAVGAFVVGISIGLGTGYKGLIILGLFFLTSSLLSLYKKQKKAELENILEKGSNRDWKQVAANGGTAAGVSLLYIQIPSDVWLIAFLIAIAAANSDTWASEIGSLSKKAPIYIRTLRPITTGTSGAVSLLGTFAGLAGAFIIAITALYLFNLHLTDFWIILFFGFLGNLIDTLLGAYIQAVYLCPICGKNMEKVRHCNSKTILQKGYASINNDAVNFLSGLIAALLGLIYFHLTNS